MHKEFAERVFRLVELYSIASDEIVAINLYSHSCTMHVEPACLLRIRTTEPVVYGHDDGTVHGQCVIDDVDVVAIFSTAEHKERLKQIGKPNQWQFATEPSEVAT